MAPRAASMCTVIVDNFTFTFDSGSHAIKYDECNFYRKRFGHMEDVKAVDVLALCGSVLLMIEAKDFREYRIENKPKLKNYELAGEVAKKIRDTVAVLYGAYRLGNEELSRFYNYCFGRNTGAVRVVLVLEEDRPPTGHRSFRVLRPKLLMAIKQRLKFLGVHCDVYNRQEVPHDCGWVVE